MEKRRLTRVQAIAAFLGLFLISVLVRRPLFNREFTDSWEWLSAHTLLTAQLWDAVPMSAHHFNLLYTFPGSANQFIDDLWNSGVADARGNYYYVSMPHLAFLVPYAGMKAMGLPLTPQSLQIFDLTLHFVVCGLMFLLGAALTREWGGRRVAALAGASVLMFAPTALFFYQNAVVGTVLVIPATIGVLWAVDRLLNGAGRTAVAWAALYASLQIGCLVDWQGYFTAFAAASVAMLAGFRNRGMRRTAFGVAGLSSLAVLTAIALTVLQNSRIAGMDAFFHTIFGRLAVRSGMGGGGFSLTDRGYYVNMARFYGSYSPFLLLAAVAAYRAWRADRELLRRVFGRGRWVLAISVLGVAADHLILAHHTAQQSFTTVNGLVPIALVLVLCVAAQSGVRGPGRWVVFGLTAAMAISIAEYLAAYRNRPHPFFATASVMRKAALDTDVMFATGADYTMKHDEIIPQLLYYLKRNVLVVSGPEQARDFLERRHLARGVLFTIKRDWDVTNVQFVAGDEQARARTMADR